MSWGQAHMPLSEIVEPQFAAEYEEDINAVVHDWVLRGLPGELDTYREKARRDHRASAISRNWRYVRRAVWERDGGICQVCKESIEIEVYECGHKVDRFLGGSDKMDNLVVMCSFCNRLKGPHDTPEEYEAWVDNGGVWGEYKAQLRRLVAPPTPPGQ